MEAKLPLIPWLVSIFYSSIPLFWLGIHPFAGRWRRMRRSPYLLLLPSWAALIVVLAWITWPWRGEHVYSTPWMWAPAIIFFAAGLRVYSRILSEFGARRLSGEAELRPEQHEQRLVTTGMHARMRHPIYFAHLCNLAGWAIGSGLLVPFLLLMLSLGGTFPLLIWVEEQELEKRFGQNFHNYKRSVPLVPRPLFSYHAGRKPA